MSGPFGSGDETPTHKPSTAAEMALTISRLETRNATLYRRIENLTVMRDEAVKSRDRALAYAEALNDLERATRVWAINPDDGIARAALYSVVQALSLSSATDVKAPD